MRAAEIRWIPLEEIRYSYKQAYKNAMIASYSHNQAFLSSGRESDMGGLQELIQTLTEELPLYLGIPSGDKVEAAGGHGLRDTLRACRRAAFRIILSYILFHCQCDPVHPGATMEFLA